MKYKQKNETLNNEFDSKKKHSRKIEGFRCNYFPQKQTEFMQRKRDLKSVKSERAFFREQSIAEIECENRMRPNLGFCTERKNKKDIIKNGYEFGSGCFAFGCSAR